jgi:hypothetical protein
MTSISFAVPEADQDPFHVVVFSTTVMVPSLLNVKTYPA